MKSYKKIGILGGSGPLVTARFFSDILNISAEKYGAEQDTDFPTVYLYNLPLEGFSETGIADAELVKKQLLAGVKAIESWGADFIVLPCNTVHYFYKEMKEAALIPVFSITETVVTRLVTQSYKKIGLLSSNSTRALGLYEPILKGHNIEALTTTDEEQETVDRIILSVMSGKQGEAELNALETIIERMAKAGAEAIVLGCTELPLVISKTRTGLLLFDSLHLLAERAVETAYKK